MTGECQEPTCILGYVHDPTQPRGKRNPPCPTCRPPRTEPLLPKINQVSATRHSPPHPQPNR